MGTLFFVIALDLGFRGIGLKFRAMGLGFRV